MVWGPVLLLVLLLSSQVSADIVAWDDAAGVRHYTNLRELVPEAYRGTAQVIVDEAARTATVATAAEGPLADDMPSPDERTRAAAVAEREAVTRAYMEGVERGMAAVGREQDPAPVVFNGPLAVAVAAPTDAPAVYAPWPPYAPLVTSSFDRGRSRHLTLRLLLQEQFAIDRDGPYAYVGRIPPLGVNLHPFLPRGLPYGPGRYGRVLVR